MTSRRRVDWPWVVLAGLCYLLGVFTGMGLTEARHKSKILVHPSAAATKQLKLKRTGNHPHQKPAQSRYTERSK